MLPGNFSFLFCILFPIIPLLTLGNIKTFKCSNTKAKWPGFFFQFDLKFCFRSFNRDVFMTDWEGEVRVSWSLGWHLTYYIAKDNLESAPSCLHPPSAGCAGVPSHPAHSVWPFIKFLQQCVQTESHLYQKILLIFPQPKCLNLYNYVIIQLKFVLQTTVSREGGQLGLSRLPLGLHFREREVLLARGSNLGKYMSSGGWQDKETHAEIVVSPPPYGWAGTSEGWSAAGKRGREEGRSSRMVEPRALGPGGRMVEPRTLGPSLAPCMGQVPGPDEKGSWPQQGWGGKQGWGWDEDSADLTTGHSTMGSWHALLLPKGTHSEEGTLRVG